LTERSTSALVAGGIALALLVLVAGCTSTATAVTEAAAATDTPAAGQTQDTLDAQYPGLSSGSLRMGRLAQLPDGVVLRAGELSVPRADLDAEIERQAKGGAGDEVRRYPFFVLENMAVEALLLQEARAWAEEQGREAQGEGLIDTYVQSMADAITVTDAEVRAFYDENPEMFDGAAYAQVVGELRPYVLYDKRRQAVADHIATLSERHALELDGQFVAEAAARENSNAVAVARRAGMPAVVDFGSEGCGPCDMMTPILAELEIELAGKCTVLFVPVREEPILAARYGIRSIPVQVFFDAEGREVFRHTGFFPKEEIMKQLAEMGVQ